LSLLDNFDFTFICIDNIAGRKTITDYLNQKKLNYIDTGIGVGISENGLF
jgi:molybdopterin/thiamine biosynthesis adenylyltransferase